MLTSSGGGGSLNADRGRGGKICQNLAEVICERPLTGIVAHNLNGTSRTGCLFQFIVPILGGHFYQEKLAYWDCSTGSR